MQVLRETPDHHKKTSEALDRIWLESSSMSIKIQRIYEAQAESRIFHNADLRTNLDTIVKTGIGRSLPTPRQYNVDDKLAELAQAYPRAYPIWIKAFERGRREYETAPNLNLSVEGHVIAEHFRRFISPYMGGFVLDVGCGPQASPVYLRGFPGATISGLDPLPGSTQRDFHFISGLAEFLPWPDDTFDVVIFATSLDHVLSLDRTLTEVHRVLRPGGFCIVWAGLIEGAALYDPLDENVSALDDYHLFHLSDETLRGAFNPLFMLREHNFHIDNSAFYAFSSKKEAR